MASMVLMSMKEAHTEGRVEGPRIAPKVLEANYRTSVSARLCCTSSIRIYVGEADDQFSCSCQDMIVREKNPKATWRTSMSIL